MQHDCHVRVYRNLLDGFVFRSVFMYPNDWRLAGRYNPRLAKILLNKG
jgi:hypothetical protein